MESKKSKMSDKTVSIETLRGGAILLVVMGHVIGSGSSGGMQVDDHSIYRYLYCLFENIRIPLFTVISGWVYSMYPVRKDDLLAFILKKVRRLLLPMIFVGSLYFILQYLVPGTNAKAVLPDIWKIYVYPYTLYWYLPALFLLFMSVIVLEISGLLSSLNSWFGVLVVSWWGCFCEISHIIPESVPNLFAFKNALYLFPFFVLGIGLNRFKDELYTLCLKRIYFVGMIAGILLQQIDYFESITLYDDMHLRIITGMISVAFLFSLNLKNNILIWLAKYAYTIYLFHGFGTSGGRILLKRINVQNELVIFIFATILAILSSIVIEKILVKWKTTRVLFLGKK